MTEVTKCTAALANGAYGKDSVHCRRSLDEAAGRTKAKPTPATAAPAKAKAIRTDVAKPAGKAKTNLVLKANKEVRALLTKACVAAGGTRLSPIGFDNYTAFLNGIPLSVKVTNPDGSTVTEGGDAVVTLIPIKGSEPVKGKNVKITIEGGKVKSIK